MQRFSGQNFNLIIGGMMVNVESASLTISDSSTVAKSGGTPDGWVDGEATASGEIVLDESNFKTVLAAARAAGSWRGLDPVDLIFYASAGAQVKLVNASECKLRLDSIVDLDPKGGEKSTTKIPFDVTGRDFVSIDGVPYLRAEEMQ